MKDTFRLGNTPDDHFCLCHLVNGDISSRSSINDLAATRLV